MSRTQLLTSSLLRTDSRLPLELRTLSLLLLPIQSSPSSRDGFSRATHGLTSVECSVFGPREPQRGTGSANQQAKDKAVVNVEVSIPAWAEKGAASTATGLRKADKSRRASEIATSLVSTFSPVLLLHLFPRSAIDIHIQVLSIDGSLLQAAINATTLALVAAGLPLTDYIVSLSLASYPSPPPPSHPIIAPFELQNPSSSTPLLDLTQAEEQALPGMTVGILPRSGKVVLVSLETRLDVNRFEELLRWAVEGSAVIQQAMAAAIGDWARTLAEPRKGLANLFPGIAGGAGGTEAEDAMLE